MPDSIRVACIQMEITDDPNHNLNRILRGIEEAGQAGARVAIFPEAALSGFSQEAVARMDEVVMGAHRGTIARLAQEKRMYVLYGCATPSGRPRPFNSGILVGPDGREVSRYHKMVPEKWFEPGDHLALFDVDDIPCTMIICHDERFPELVRIPVLAGARICFYISFEVNSRENALLKKEGYRAQLIARASENGIWVVQANGVGGGSGGTNSVSLGYSRIVAPDGQVVIEAPGEEDAMNVWDIRPEQARRGNAMESLSMAPLAGWWGSAVLGLRGAVAVGENAPPMERTSLRVALMQDEPTKWDLERNFQTFLRLIEEASEEKAELFMTPECWLDGYAAPDNGSSPERLRGIAQDLQTSVYLREVAQQARKRSIWICFGFTSWEDDHIYNAAGLWDSNGQRVGIYHKTHLQTHDLQYAPGRDLPVWPSPWGPLGIMICADRRWPETARALRLKGARVILNPTYGMCHEDNEWWMRTRGYENQCYIAFCHPKTSFVVDPRGGFAAARRHMPGVLVCDLDLTQASDEGHLTDRRPDLYEILTAPKIKECPPPKGSF